MPLFDPVLHPFANVDVLAIAVCRTGDECPHPDERVGTGRRCDSREDRIDQMTECPAERRTDEKRWGENTTGPARAEGNGCGNQLDHRHSVPYISSAFYEYHGQLLTL